MVVADGLVSSWPFPGMGIPMLNILTWGSPYWWDDIFILRRPPPPPPPPPPVSYLVYLMPVTRPLCMPPIWSIGHWASVHKRTPSCWYRDSHHKPETVVRPCWFMIGIPVPVRQRLNNRVIIMIIADGYARRRPVSEYQEEPMSVHVWTPHPYPWTDLREVSSTLC